MKEVKRRGKVAFSVMDGDGGLLENLVRRIIRSVQEPSADLRWPTTLTAKANLLTRDKSKSLTAKANSLTAKADGSRQKQIGKL